MSHDKASSSKYIRVSLLCHTLKLHPPSDVDKAKFCILMRNINFLIYDMVNNHPTPPKLLNN